MKNFLLKKIGKINKQKQKYKKMTASTVNLQLLNKYSEDYIKKTMDFQDMEKVKLILVKLTEQREKANLEEKKTLQKFINLYQV